MRLVLLQRILSIAIIIALGGLRPAWSNDSFIVQPSLQKSASVVPKSPDVLLFSEGGKTQLVSMVSPVGPSSGWEAIGRQLAGHLSRSEQLSRRGVLLSAREEANQALLLLARHLDLLSNHFVSEPSFHSAQTALREVVDFTNWLHTTDPARIQQIVDSHETQVLKQVSWENVSPLTIAQHYHRFAERTMVDASQGHPWFSDILYVLGRTYQAQADQTTGAVADTYRMHALVHYRAALEIRPTHALAANQAGFVLLQLDRPMEAKGFLLASARQHRSREALQNLVEASRRLQDGQTESWALHGLASIESTREVAQGVPAVEILDQRTFAALSPMASGPKSPPSSRVAESPTASTVIGGQR